MRTSLPAFLALLVLSFTPTVHGQVLTRVTPEAAAQGDLLIINGVGLGGVTAVRFFAPPTAFPPGSSFGNLRLVSGAHPCPPLSA